MHRTTVQLSMPPMLASTAHKSCLSDNKEYRVLFCIRELSARVRAGGKHNKEGQRLLCARQFMLDGGEETDEVVQSDVLCIVIISCWYIWKQRNGWIFKNIRPTFRGWKSSFFHEVSLLMYRIKKDTIPLLSSWLASLP
jgi:hypothetical protein